VNPAETIRALRREGRHEEARDLAVRLAQETPGDGELQYETACVHDALGREGEAVPFYRAAIEGGLPPDLLRGAFLGLGSTYRALGRYEDAERTLLQGLDRFPDAPEIRTFLAMTLHNLGRSKEAVEALLNVLAKTSRDPHIERYRKAIAFYAQDVERSWE
jgi:tetratricopeptide (TPR) repeat protein